MAVTQRKSASVVSSSSEEKTTTATNDDATIPEGYKLREPRKNINELIANGPGEEESFAESMAFPLFLLVAFVGSLYFYLKLPSLLRSE